MYCSRQLFFIVNLSQGVAYKDPSHWFRFFGEKLVRPIPALRKVIYRCPPTLLSRTVLALARDQPSHASNAAARS